MLQAADALRSSLSHCMFSSSIAWAAAYLYLAQRHATAGWQLSNDTWAPPIGSCISQPIDMSWIVCYADLCKCMTDINTCTTELMAQLK